MNRLPDVRLRAVEPEDADLMFEAENDELATDSTDHVAPLSRRQVFDYAMTYDADPFRAGQLRLIVEDAAGQAVGIADLYEISALHARAFVAIYILPSRRREGMAHAALKALGRYAAGSLGIRRLAARILDANDASKSLFEKAGFVRCATIPDWHFASGRLQDMHIYIKSDR